jgi:RimJ/RimL family protein N-acetyltransferase
MAAHDCTELYAVARDPLIWAGHPAHDRWQEPVFRRIFEEGLASGGAMVAIDLASGKIIGSSRFHDYDPERSEVEIGWTFLARSYWGGAYNGEMKRLMLEHAFRFVENAVFLVAHENLRSQKALIKIGAELVGTRIDRKGAERLMFRITRSGYT